jgi:hypothetical protein
MDDSSAASYIQYVDSTSSALSSAFEESSAVSGNLSSLMRNWIVLLDEPIGARLDPFSDGIETGCESSGAQLVLPPGHAVPQI